MPARCRPAARYAGPQKRRCHRYEAMTQMCCDARRRGRTTQPDAGCDCAQPDAHVSWRDVHEIRPSAPSVSICGICVSARPAAAISLRTIRDHSPRCRAPPSTTSLADGYIARRPPRLYQSQGGNYVRRRRDRRTRGVRSPTRTPGGRMCMSHNYLRHLRGTRLRVGCGICVSARPPPWFP